MKALIAAALLASVAFARPARADDRASSTDLNRAEIHREDRDRDRLGWYVPDFARLQTAGFLGVVGVGLGYAAFDDVLNVSLSYGFSPAAHSGKSVHAGRLAIDVRPFDLRLDAFRLVPVYLGGSVLHAFGSEYFTRLPDRFARLDRYYYPPTSLHWGAQLGLELDYVPSRGPIERHGLYYELVTVDSYLFSFLENSKSLGLDDVVSSSLGYRCAF
jgi:hypothetical protein